MTREEKAQIIEGLTGKFQEFESFYLTDSSSLTVAEVNDFRRLCHEKGIGYKVFKNTLIQKSLDNLEGDYTDLYTTLKGFSGVMFASAENANLPAKVLKEYRKKSGGKKPLLKAASIDAEFYFGEENLTFLSELKSKGELIGEVITLLQSPAKNVVSALQSGKANIGGLLKTLSERN